MNTELVDAHQWSVYNQLNNEELEEGKVVVIKSEPSEEMLLATPKVDYLFIKGSRIRYFHLPPEIDIIESIETQLSTFRRRRTNTTERPFNWKSYRKRQKMEQLQAKLGDRQQQLSSPSTSFTPPPPPPPPPPPSTS